MIEKIIDDRLQPKVGANISTNFSEVKTKRNVNT